MAQAEKVDYKKVAYYQEIELITIMNLFRMVSFNYKKLSVLDLTEMFINGIIYTIWDDKCNCLKSIAFFLSAILTEISRIANKLHNIKFLLRDEEKQFPFSCGVEKILFNWCHIVYDAHFTMKKRPLLLSRISEFNDIKRFMKSSKLYLVRSSKKILSSDCLVFEKWQINNKCFDIHSIFTLKVHIVGKIISADYLFIQKGSDLDELMKYIEMLCSTYIKQAQNIAFANECIAQSPFITIVLLTSLLFNTIPSIHHAQSDPNCLFQRTKLNKLIKIMKYIKIKFKDKCWKTIINVGIADIKLSCMNNKKRDMMRIIKTIDKATKYIVSFDWCKEHCDLSDIFKYQIPYRICNIYQYLVYNDMNSIISNDLHQRVSNMKLYLLHDPKIYKDYLHDPKSLDFVNKILDNLVNDNVYGFLLKNIINNKRCHYKNCNKRNTKLKICKRCRKGYYCNRRHQKLDWKFGNHRIYCISYKVTC